MKTENNAVSPYCRSGSPLVGLRRHLPVRASGLDHSIFQRRLDDLGIVEKRGAARESVRQEGGRHKKIRDRDPRILADLESLVEPLSLGDLQSPLRWTCMNTQQLAEALRRKDYQVSRRVVVEMHPELGYSLQANVTVRKGADHLDRDAQFGYINQQVERYLVR